MRASHGFTLIELLVVIALIAIGTAAVSFSLRDSAETVLERDAERLAALFESARARSRASGVPVKWHPQSLNNSGAPSAFVFEGLPPPGLPRDWLTPTTRVAPDTAVTLGPEPLIEPRAVALSSLTRPERQVWVVTDGLRPFKVQNTPKWVIP